MDRKKDFNKRYNNKMYYNQIRNNNSSRKKKTSFTSKKIKLENIVLAPEGYEGIFFSIYFLIIPYLVGAIFLFLFIAGADFSSFMLLNMSSLFIVWAIGYEIVAVISLLIIFTMYLRHDD